jgi:hypothetical protein
MATCLQSILYHDEEGNTVDPEEIDFKSASSSEVYSGGQEDWFNDSDDSGEINIEEILGGSLFENLLNEIRGGGDEENDFVETSSDGRSDSSSESDSESEDGEDNEDGEDKQIAMDESDNEFFNGGEELTSDEPDLKFLNDDDDIILQDSGNPHYRADNLVSDGGFFNVDVDVGAEEEKKNDLASGGSFSELAQSIASKFLS